MPGRRPGPRRGDPLPADGGGGPVGAPHVPPARRDARRGRASSRCASTTTAPATPPGSRTTRTGSRPGWPASRRPASTSSTSARPTSSAVGMRLGATLAGCQAAASAPFRLAGPVGPLPERPHLPARGRGAVRPRRGRRPGARRRLRHTPGFQYDAATASAMRRLDLAKLPADRPLGRPGAAAVPHRPAGSREHREAGPARAGPGRGRPRDGAGPAARPDAQRLLRPGGGARLRRRLAGGRQRRGPGPGQGAGGASRPAGRRRPPGRPSSSSARCGSAPLGLYGVVDEPLAPTATAPWVVLVNVAAEHHIGPGPALGRVGPALGRRRLPGHPDRPDRRRRQPRPRGAGRGRDVRPRVDRRHARGRADPVRGRRPGGRGRSLLRLLLGVRGRAVGEGRGGLRGQPAGHPLPGREGHPRPHLASAAPASCLPSRSPRWPSGSASWPAASGGSTASSPSGTARSGSCAAWSSAAPPCT